MTDLVQLGEVKEYLKISSNQYDNALSNAISYASSLVENYCGREFFAANVTEYHDGGASSIFVNRIPINNVYSVAQYDGTTYAVLDGPNSDGSLPEVNANSNATQFIWHSSSGRVQRNIEGGGMPTLGLFRAPAYINYPRGVKIVYNGGYTTLPMDLKLATLDIVKDIHKGIESKSVTLQGETMQRFDYLRGLPPHITRILDLYRIQA